MVVVTGCRSNMSYNSALGLKYEKIFSQYINARNLKENSDPGLVILEKFHTDTLNRNEYEPNKFKMGVLVDGKFVPLVTKEDEIGYAMLFSKLRHSRDTLQITIEGIWPEERTELKIFSNQASTSYEKLLDERKLFKLSLADSAAHELKVPAQTKHFTLSEKLTGKSDFLYVETEMVTQPFYTSSPFFKGGYLLQRYHEKYIMKIDRRALSQAK